MMAVPRTTLLALVAVFAACAGLSPSSVERSRPISPAGGSVWVYLVEPGSSAERLQVVVDGIGAVDASGRAYPLTLHARRIEGTAERGDLLLAEGPLPAGAYTGLQVQIGRASLERGEETASLRVPEDPVRVRAEFEIRRREAIVLHVALATRESVVSGYRFEPALSGVRAPEPAFGLFAVAVCRGQDALFFYDKMTGRPFDVLPVGADPSSALLDADRRLAFVALAGDDAVAVVALEERRILERIPLGAGDEPEEIVAAAGGRTLIAANPGSGTVSFVDAVSLIESARLTVGDAPRAIRVEPGGRRAWVADTFSDTLTVIDLDRREVVATIGVDPEPYRLAFDRLGERLYVIHRATPHLTVVDPLTSTVLRRVYVGTGVRGVSVDPNSGRILLSRAGTGAIDLYDPESLLPVDTIPTGGDVGWMTIDSETNVLHAVLEDRDRVRLVRLAARKVAGEAAVGRNPVRIAVAGER